MGVLWKLRGEERAEEDLGAIIQKNWRECLSEVRIQLLHKRSLDSYRHFFLSHCKFCLSFFIIHYYQPNKSNKVKAKEAMNTTIFFWLRPPTVTDSHSYSFSSWLSSTVTVSSLQFSLHHSHFSASSAVFLFPFPILPPLHFVHSISASLFITDQLIGFTIGFIMPFSVLVNSDSIAWVVLLEIVFPLTDSSSSFATGVEFHCARFLTLIQSGLGDYEWVVRSSLELWGFGVKEVCKLRKYYFV